MSDFSQLLHTVCLHAGLGQVCMILLQWGEGHKPLTDTFLSSSVKSEGLHGRLK